MSERLQKILEYEKELIKSREKLIELIAEGAEAQEDQQELLDYKLMCFQREIGLLNRQLELLKKEATPQKANVVVEKTEEVSEQSAEWAQTIAVTKESATQTVQADRKVFQTTHNTATQQQTVRREAKNIFPSKKDLEKTIGKSLMGIFASVLIFISLILFATLLLPYFNDTAKMITTYIISFAFLGVGVVKLKKDPDNKFFTALTGCGMGALYISLLLSNMYF